jgi:hypothetical protein
MVCPQCCFSSARLATPFLVAFVLQCLLQRSLVSAARPTSNDEVQSLNLAMMRAGGAMVRQHLKDEHGQQSLQENRSSMLQLLQHDKFDEKKPEETDFDGANIGGVGASLQNDIDGAQIDQVNDIDGAQIGQVKANLENSSNGLDLGVDGTTSGELDTERLPTQQQDSEELGRIDSHDPPIPDTINSASQVVTGQTTNAVESGPKEKEEEHVPPLGPGEEMKMFRAANSKVGEMEERAKTMQGHLTDVDAAWGRVDGKLTSYGESIEDLKRQVSKLSESAHGLHGEVRDEFHGKEKFRMSARNRLQLDRRHNRLKM